MREYKILLLLMTIILPSLAFAGGFNFEINPKYSGDIHIAYGTQGASELGFKPYNDRTIIGTLQGVRLNQWVQASLGVDAIMFNHYYRGQGLRFAMDTYADLRGFYPINENIEAFLDLGLGAVYGVHPSGDANFFCEFGPGIRYKKLLFSLGLQNLGTSKSSSTFFVKIGIKL